jgi:PST family polysaccharide transporter
MIGTEGLGSRVRSGLLWSLLSNVTLRLGTLATGIVLARILDPEAFGVFAIALTVQTVLMTVSELGLAADLVRHGRFAERGPTIATLSLISSGALTLAVWLSAPALATFLGSGAAAPVIRVLSLALLLAGLAVVPFARLQRDLRQRDLFRIELVAFLISTVLSIGLAVVGLGAMAIAVGQVCAMLAVVVLEFVVTRSTPVFGWDRDVAISGLRFGFPLSCAGLLSLTLLSIDNAMVGRLQGATMLGFYVLAFNVSSWPTTVIGRAVRAVAMPAFAHRSDSTGRADERALVQFSSLTWAVAVPISTALGILAVPVIGILYGAQWDRAAPVLIWLAALGAVRILVDVWVAYLTAAGRSGLLLCCQAAWLLALAPMMWWAVGTHGLEGAGGAHVAVALVAIPAYLLALRATGIRITSLARPLLLPVLAAVPAGAAGLLVTRATSDPWLQLFGGGLAIVGVYAAVLGRWVIGLLPAGVLRRGMPSTAGTTEPAVAGARVPAAAGARKDER